MLLCISFCSKTVFVVYGIFSHWCESDKAVIMHYQKSLYPFTSLLFLVSTRESHQDYLVAYLLYI